MTTSSPSSRPPPHPLAERLIARLRPGATVLEIGSGSGRNTEALRRAHISLESPSGYFSAALSTHSLLHGNPNEIATLIETIAERLEPHGLFYATFGSKSDARFGTGEKFGEQTYAQTEGDERGVPHSYFSEAELRVLLEPYFEIERIEEINVDTIAGTWAHKQKPLANAVHWFIEASLRLK